MALLTFRVRNASGSLELLVQHDMRGLAKIYGCSWLDHLCMERGLEDRVVGYSLDDYAACACWLLFSIF